MYIIPELSCPQITIIGIIVYTVGVIITAITGSDSYEEMTSKDVRKALLWPLLLLMAIIKGVVFIINELIVMFLLILGIQYKKYWLYKYIDEWTLKTIT